MFKAGRYEQQFEYKSFLPSLINKSHSFNDPQINLLLEEARGHLGELNAFAKFVPDLKFFIKMHIRKEATTSSRIEGTKADITNVVLPEKEIAPEKKDDWKEVQNYIKAMNFAIEERESLPLSMRLIQNCHKHLLSSTREGERKHPGEIRKSQNWIGGSSLKDAFFIPPHHEKLPDLLTDFEKFWHNKNLQIPKLIKIAMSHYQFETIHPFLDGNGRVGRLLIILQLIDSDILTNPCLYLSDFFEKNKNSYYDSLTMVRQTNNINQWIKFFLSGVIETSKKGKETLESIMEMRSRFYLEIDTHSQSKYGKDLLVYLFSEPIVSITKISSHFKITYRSATNLVNKFQQIGILKEITGHSRNRLFVLEEYLNLFK